MDDNCNCGKTIETIVVMPTPMTVTGTGDAVVTAFVGGYNVHVPPSATPVVDINVSNLSLDAAGLLQLTETDGTVHAVNIPASPALVVTATGATVTQTGALGHNVNIVVPPADPNPIVTGSGAATVTATPTGFNVDVDLCPATPLGAIELCPGDTFVGCGGQEYIAKPACPSVANMAEPVAPLTLDLAALCASGASTTPTVWRAAHSEVAAGSSTALGGGSVPVNPWTTSQFAVNAGEVLIVAVAYAQATIGNLLSTKYAGDGAITSTSPLLGPVEFVSRSNPLHANFWGGATFPDNGFYVIEHYAIRVLASGNVDLTFTVTEETAAEGGRFSMTVNAGSGNYPTSGAIVRQHAEVIGNAENGAKFGVAGDNPVPLVANLAQLPLDLPLWSVSGVHFMNSAFDASGLSTIDMPVVSGICNLGISTAGFMAQSYGPSAVQNDAFISTNNAYPNEVSGIELNVLPAIAAPVPITELDASLNIQNGCECNESMVVTSGFHSGVTVANLPPGASYELTYEVNGSLVQSTELSNNTPIAITKMVPGVAWNTVVAPSLVAGATSSNVQVAVKIKCINHVAGSVVTISPYQLSVIGTP